MSEKANSETGSRSGTNRKRHPAECSPVAVGDLIADKYRVEVILAAGGMGVVVAAIHEQLGQRYAIKLLLPDQTSQVERFLREARAAARIESAHVCRVFDCGTLPNGIPYMVMEHLTGHDLARELKARGQLTISEAVDLMLQAIEGIAEAHALGVVHRDLKPSNLFLCQRPGRLRQVKVLDFGISKLAKGLEANVEEDLTATAAMLGSPRYMSPEQVRSAKSVDVRTDIWSLGVILYQMLDGQSPFKGVTMGETLSKVLLHIPPPIVDSRPDVPGPLAQVIDRCLQRDREKRYRNVAELALALAPFASPEGKSSIGRVTALLVDGQLGGPGDPPSGSERTTVEVPRQSKPVSAVPGPLDEPSLGTQSAFTNSTRARARPAKIMLALGGVALLGAAGLWLALRAPRPSNKVQPTEQTAPDLAAPGSPTPAVKAVAPPASAKAQASPATSASTTPQASSSAAAQASAKKTSSSAAAKAETKASSKTTAKRSAHPVHQSRHRPARPSPRTQSGNDTDILGESY